MDRRLSQRLGELLEFGVRQSVFSGAQAAVVDGAGLVARARAGRTAPGGGAPVTHSTLFDIASLTKVFTASATLRLAARGVVDLGTRLEALLPELRGASTGAATLEQVLAHEAGLAAWLPLFEQVALAERGTQAGRRRIVELALAAPLEAQPGERAIYSDLGFIALGEMLERVTGADLGAIIAAEVTGPLGLASVRPGPVRPGSRCAATEDCPWRGRVLRGEVHDDNAWAMGGLAGHAGLFAAAADVARFGAAWLEARRDGGWLPAELASRATRRRPLGRGLGWDLKNPDGSSAGARFSIESFGHLGFTGCSLWVDPLTGVAAALLTNRVCFGRDNDAIRGFRPAFHNAISDLPVGGR
ncbi:MAG TPA: serine hydrolase domain-containing protein [Polyangia bacterium]|nr:serine hydrolase domain-containing protein [Polyangia bacterium]